MRIIRTTAPWVLLLSFTALRAVAQEAPLWTEFFVEGGGSFIRNTTAPVYCNEICTPAGCPSCPSLPFSNAGRLFSGVRVRAGHDAVEASYSYSPNQASGYNRLNLVSFNYVRYLSLRSKVQPFATVGLGAGRFSGPSNPPASFKFVWNYGGGADIALHRRLALRLELRDYVNGQPRYFVGTAHSIVPTAGIVFRFR